MPSRWQEMILTNEYAVNITEGVILTESKENTTRGDKVSYHRREGNGVGNTLLA